MGGYNYRLTQPGSETVVGHFLSETLLALVRGRDLRYLLPLNRMVDGSVDLYGYYATVCT